MMLSNLIADSCSRYKLNKKETSSHFQLLSFPASFLTCKYFLCKKCKLVYGLFSHKLNKFHMHLMCPPAALITSELLILMDCTRFSSYCEMLLHLHVQEWFIAH